MNYDVAVVGGGPAGLSAALLLARCRRRLAVCDHSRPRNYAARIVNGYLGLEGMSPTALREAGRRQVSAYGAELIDREVTGVKRREGRFSRFEISISGHAPIEARKLLLATGVRDTLPDVEGLAELYGTSVHHCPYCDGWEHRDERLVALGSGDDAASLGLSLRTWSADVIVCANGTAISDKKAERLTENGIAVRRERLVRLAHHNGQLRQIEFAGGPPLPCDAVFFSDAKVQRSHLPAMLGCEYDEKGLIRTRGKQGTGIDGLFLAGDADGDTQFAIVAAAEGAIAATAINHELQEEDCILRAQQAEKENAEATVEAL
jgi:thioredoxin reductase